MKKINYLRAAVITMFLLFLFQCRTSEESINLQNAETNEKIDAFVRFEQQLKKAKKSKTISEDGDSYAPPFIEIIKQFFENHPDYHADFTQNVGTIDFRVTSQTIGEDEKMVLFPILKENKANAVLFCRINKERDFVKFRIVKDRHSEFGSTIDEFQDYYDKISIKKNIISSKAVQIAEVVISIWSRYANNFSEIIIPDWGWNGGGGSSGSTMDGSGGVHNGGGGAGRGGDSDGKADSNDPCSKIKSNLTDAKFNEKSASLNTSTVLNYDHEMGFASSYAPAGTNLGTQYQPMDNKIGTHSVRLPDGDRFFGFMHTHNNEDGVVKIFSPADVMTFLTSCVSNANAGGNIRDAYAMVITSEGSYMLQYNSTSANFGNLSGSLNNWNRQYREDFQKIMNEDGTFTQSNIENAFLQFLKNTVNINGLELYKIDGTTSKKLSLNTNNTTNTTPCP